jgi:hypothetical protein
MPTPEDEQKKVARIEARMMQLAQHHFGIAQGLSNAIAESQRDVGKFVIGVNSAGLLALVGLLAKPVSETGEQAPALISSHQAFVPIVFFLLGICFGGALLFANSRRIQSAYKAFSSDKDAFLKESLRDTGQEMDKLLIMIGKDYWKAENTALIWVFGIASSLCFVAGCGFIVIFAICSYFLSHIR